MGDDRFLDAMEIAAGIFAIIAVVTALAHIAHRFGFRLGMVPFVPVLEYSILMVVITAIIAVLYDRQTPGNSLMDERVDTDWEDEDGDDP